MASTMTNATIRGGSCSSYATGAARFCYDCLNYAVISEVMVR